MTLDECARAGEAALRVGPHPERARLDAETLLQHVTGKNRAWRMAHGSDEFGGCTAARYGALLERRRTGEPIQYITGECEFYGLPFRVTRDVLIPRPETEHLVEAALAISNRWGLKRVVDVGTGSGAIAVALAHALPQTHSWTKARVTAVDISGAALDVARGNAERNGVAPRIRFLESDLLGAVAGERFDLVVSNPPYVAEADASMLAVEVREHEPALALFGGEDGLAAYRRLIPQAFTMLDGGGFLALEIGYGQAAAVKQLMEASGFGGVELRPDLQGIPRVAWGRKAADHLLGGVD